MSVKPSQSHIPNESNPQLKPRKWSENKLDIRSQSFSIKQPKTKRPALQTKSGTPGIYSSFPPVMDWHLYSAFLDLLIDIDLAIQSYSALF